MSCLFGAKNHPVVEPASLVAPTQPLPSLEDDEDYDDLIGEDEWEDKEALQAILDKLPNGWFLIKVERFSASTLVEMDEWLADNCMHAYERINWRSGCSYMVGVQFEDGTDAVFFRLRWSL